jgi:hypothetical protein
MTLQTLLKRLATEITYTAPPEALEDTTFGVITGNITNPFGDKIFIYIRKNTFDLVTDLEIVVTSGVLKNDVAIELIKPDTFITAEDLEDRLDDAVGHLISTLKMNQEEYRAASSQLDLFPTEDLEIHSFDLANRLN